ncbi:PqqD family protein [Phytoactinopolyspora mesophila]|nr:PqqD family protein [Phytoactinopolyspora mesophila]
MSKLHPMPDVHQVSTADGTVLLAADRGHFYGLNPAGSVIWTALCEGNTVDQVIRELGTRFDTPPDRIRGDVTDLVAQLCDRGLLAIG